MGFNGFSWVLLGFNGFFWVFLGFTGFCWVLLGFTEFCWVKQETRTQTSFFSDVSSSGFSGRCRSNCAPPPPRHTHTLTHTHTQNGRKIRKIEPPSSSDFSFPRRSITDPHLYLRLPSTKKPSVSFPVSFFRYLVSGILYFSKVSS